MYGRSTGETEVVDNTSNLTTYKKSRILLRSVSLLQEIYKQFPSSPNLSSSPSDIVVDEYIRVSGGPTGHSRNSGFSGSGRVVVVQGTEEGREIKDRDEGTPKSS